MKFEELGLDDTLLEALSYMGFEEATPIQEKAIPPILEGNDIIACAQTGTGKTAAFLLPVLSLLAHSEKNHTSTLIIAPTRELALQIEQQVQGLAYFAGVDSLALYGGGDGIEWSQQKRALEKGTDIIVATPGKLISHLNMNNGDFSKVKFLILDEADRMLDIGFHDDILKILSFLPKERQTLMFSATMPKKIREFAKKILKTPTTEITIAVSKPAKGVLQAAYLVNDEHKIELVSNLLKDKPNYESIIIFCSTKQMVSKLARTLKKKNYSVEEISSSLEQKKREEVLLRFRAKHTRIMVGTDVVSRGIDIKGINLVINFDVPGDAEDYVHRIGRTARADSTGVALTFVNQDDMYKFQQIERLIETEVMKLKIPKPIGESPEWKPNASLKKKRRKGSKHRNKPSHHKNKKRTKKN